MKKHKINMPNYHKSEDGDCFTKCLQEIYYYYNFPISTTKIAAITKVFDTVYYPVDGNKVSDLSGKFTMNTDIDKSNLKKIPLQLIYLTFQDEQESIQTLKNIISENNPVLLSLNTYYLHYTPDYLTNSGGFFKSGHSVIVYGYDDASSLFYLEDPTFEVDQAEVSYEELLLAWTYTKDTIHFKPLEGFHFSAHNRPFHIKNLMKDSLLENIESYYDTSSNQTDGVISYHGMNGFHQCLKDFEQCLRSNYSDEIKDIFLDNLYFSIFHKIRWSRKSFSLFLKSSEFYEYTNLNKFVDTFDTISEDWNLLGTLLYTAIQSNSTKRLEKSYQMMKNLIEDEYTALSYLREYEQYLL